MNELRRQECKQILADMVAHVSAGGSVGGLAVLQDRLMAILAMERKENAELKRTTDSVPRSGGSVET